MCHLNLSEHPTFLAVQFQPVPTHKQQLLTKHQLDLSVPLTFFSLLQVQ